MRDHTVCLLKECDSGCKMALDSMAQIKGYVSDQKLKNTIDGYEKKHQAMEEEAYKQLKSLGEGGKEPEMMAAAKGPKVKPPMQTTTSLKSKSKNMTLGISLDRSITM